MAFFLAFLAKGLGYLYAREPLLAVATPLVFIIGYTASLLLLSFGATALEGAVVMVIVYVGVDVGVPFHAAFREARPRAGGRRPPFSTITCLLFSLGSWAFCVPMVWAARYFIAEPYRIPTASMAPTLLEGESIVVGKLSLRPEELGGRLAIVRRGEGSYVKRVVGLPGQIITIEGGRVLVDGQELLPPCGSAEISLPPTRVPPDTVYVLSDNLDSGSDSRLWGPIPFSDVAGRVSARSFSLQRKTGWLPTSLEEPSPALTGDPCMRGEPTGL